MHFGMTVYCFADLGEGCELEDFGCEEVLLKLAIMQQVFSNL